MESEYFDDHEEVDGQQWAIGELAERPEFSLQELKRARIQDRVEEVPIVLDEWIAQDPRVYAQRDRHHHAGEGPGDKAGSACAWTAERRPHAVRAGPGVSPSGRRR